MKYYAIIVAGGSGSRMKAEVPKQFLLVAGKPILMHTIEAFYHSDFKPEIILVLPRNFHDYWNMLCAQFNFVLPFRLAEGGKQRFDSVKNGLSLIDDDGVIAIHDAVRPLITNDVISQSYRVAAEQGSAVTVVASRDSVRQVKDGRSAIVDRETIFLVQTPQTFQSRLLKTAYELPYEQVFTDDASVVERSGSPVTLIAGTPQNIKITFPEDLILAACFLEAKKNPAANEPDPYSIQ